MHWERRKRHHGIRPPPINRMAYAHIPDCPSIHPPYLRVPERRRRPQIRVEESFSPVGVPPGGRFPPRLGEGEGHAGLEGVIGDVGEAAEDLMGSEWSGKGSEGVCVWVLGGWVLGELVTSLGLFMGGKRKERTSAVPYACMYLWRKERDVPRSAAPAWKGP